MQWDGLALQMKLWLQTLPSPQPQLVAKQGALQKHKLHNNFCNLELSESIYLQINP